MEKKEFNEENFICSKINNESQKKSIIEIIKLLNYEEKNSEEYFKQFLNEKFKNQILEILYPREKLKLYENDFEKLRDKQNSNISFITCLPGSGITSLIILGKSRTADEMINILKYGQENYDKNNSKMNEKLKNAIVIKISFGNSMS